MDQTSLQRAARQLAEIEEKIECQRVLHPAAPARRPPVRAADTGELREQPHTIRAALQVTG